MCLQMLIYKAKIVVYVHILKKLRIMVLSAYVPSDRFLAPFYSNE